MITTEGRREYDECFLKLKQLSASIQAKGYIFYEQKGVGCLAAGEVGVGL
jgi:hypothetical protein